jgi:hypothetical protein
LLRPNQVSVSCRHWPKEILILGRSHFDHDGYDQDARRAFLLALLCKTPEMGRRRYASEDEERLFGNTCKSPACPSCGHWATMQWQRERWCALPDGPYVEITLTMPDTLWRIFARNRFLCRKLSAIAGRIIRSFARVSHGIEVGVMPITHTFNGELLFKPHVHSLVTAGGLETSRSCWRRGIFFERDKLMRSWQRLIIALLRASLERGLEFEGSTDELENLFRFEEARRWIAHIRRFKGKEHFLRYCGRYLRRPPIANWRILEVKEGSVRFWHKDTRRKQRILVECKLEEFIDRWSQHIPKHYQHSVRHFGLFASARWSRIGTAILTILGVRQRPKPKRVPWAISVQRFGMNPLQDSKGRRMKFVGHVAPSAALKPAV